MAVTLIVDGDDLTDGAENLQWTTVDPGGFETCSFTLPDTETIPAPGAPIVIWEGMQRVWMGNVEEPGDEFRGDQAPGQVSGVGAGAPLKDNDLSVIYIDRDLSHWQGISTQRRINLANTYDPANDSQVIPDTSTGAPGLRLECSGHLPGSTGAVAEGWYDAGVNLIAGLIFGSSDTLAATNFTLAAYGCDSDTAAGPTAAVGTAANATTLATAYRAFAAAKRWALIQWIEQIGPYTTDENQRWRMVKDIAVIGNHGLTLQGSTGVEGFYAEDIARHALSTVAGIVPGIIEASGFIARHAVYRDPVAQEQIIDEMAKLLGWHWGVWEPLSMLNDTPRLDFRAPPSAATAVVARSDCQLTLTKQLSAMHDQARVFYTDAAGQRGNVLISLPNPQLPAGRHRTLQVDMGAGDAAAAAIYGGDALALEQAQTRAAGSGELPATVTLPGGGQKLAHLLKPGIDRLKVTGLPNAGTWTEADTARYDTFRIARLTAARQTGGGVRTTVELDRGADLMETLTADLTLARTAGGI